MNPLLAPLVTALAPQPPQKQPSAMAVPGLNPAASQQPQLPKAQPHTAERDSGLRRFLGSLGDALLVANGGEPLYQQSVERREMGAQLANYLGTDNPQLAQILMDNPELGMSLYNAQRQDKAAHLSHGLEERRVANSERVADANIEQGDRRINTTIRGQDIQAQIAQARLREEQAERELRWALQRGDQAHAERMLQLQTQAQAQLAQLEATLRGSTAQGDEPVGSYQIEDEGEAATPAVDNWGPWNTPANPGRPATRTQVDVFALPAGGPSAAIRGRVYQTPDGVGRWDGRQFVDPTTGAPL